MTVRARNNYYLIIFTIVCLSIALACGIIGAVFPVTAWVSRPAFQISSGVGIGVIATKFLSFCLTHKLFVYGLNYCLKHNRLMRTIENELVRCEVYKKKDCNGIITPLEILMNLDGNLCGRIFIADLPKFHSKLESLEFSSLLPDYLVIENKYLTDNRNYWVLEVRNFDLKPLNIESVDDLINLAKQEPYKIAISDYLSVPVHHGILIGQTGSGKSYSLIYIIMSLFCKQAELYVADPKQTDIAVLSEELLSDERYASEPDKIIELIRRFGTVLKERQNILQNHLHSSDEIARSYQDFGLRPVCLIIDEFSAFILSLSKQDRDSVMSVLLSVVLKGRQVGCFLVLAQQQSNAKNLPTELKENMPLKIILGNSGRETYITALGIIPEASKRKFEVGQGLLVYPGISTEENPIVVAMPRLGQEEVICKQGIRKLKEAVLQNADSISIPCNNVIGAEAEPKGADHPVKSE